MEKTLPDLSAFTSSLTPGETCRRIAADEKRRRKSLGLTQQELAKKAGVSLGSLKRFEQQGEIALASLLRLAMALDALNDFLDLFNHSTYQSIEDVLNDSSRKS
jgi:transcriptional regulator with XRE-family HTH domain